MTSTLGAIVLTIGCVFLYSASQLPPQDFSTTDLLIPQDSLPEGWVADELHTSFTTHGYGENDAAFRYHTRVDEPGSRGAFAKIVVYHYSVPAEYDYQRVRDGYILPEGWGWEAPPAELSFTGSQADEWAEGCKSIAELSVYRCTYFARYLNFLLEVDFDLDTGATPQDFLIDSSEVIAILRAQDERMAAFITGDG